MDLAQTLNNILQGAVIDKISQKTNAKPDDVQKVIQVGLPILIGQLANNASDKAGAKELDQAIAKDHTGNDLLDSLSSLFNEGDKNSDGEKILKHIFGSDKVVANKVAAKTDLDMDTIVKILSFVAPMLMAQLGKTKSKAKLDSDSLSDLLKSQTDAKGNPLSDLANAMLDKNKDGSIIDDILGMFRK